MPLIEQTYELTDELCRCPSCCNAREKIGMTISHTVEFLPGSFVRVEHVQHKYACRSCEQNGYSPNITLVAETGGSPIDKGLPGPGLWDEFAAQGRIAADRFPEDWRHYTLTFPVARYWHFSGADLAAEMETCDQTFYSLGSILRRAWGSLWHRRKPLIALVANLSYRSNLPQSRENCQDFLAKQRRRVTADHYCAVPRSEPARIPPAARVTPQSSMAEA